MKLVKVHLNLFQMHLNKIYDVTPIPDMININVTIKIENMFFK